MKVKYFLFIFAFLIICSQFQLGLSFFPKSHIAWTINSFNSLDSPIVEKCRPYLNIVLDGDTGSDLGVLHYGDQNKITSYIYPHTLGGYQTCLGEAGADIELQCMCYGNYLHILQDSYSHTNGGLVQKYLKSQLGSNYFGHMSIERSFENKHVELLNQEGSYAITSGQLDYYNTIVLNSFFSETGGNPKFLNLMSEVSGIDMSNDARIFRSGYLGEGFYSTIYQDKVSLPWWAYGVSIGLIIIGFGMGLFVLILGKSKYKYLTSIWWFILSIIGIIILISFVTGTSWKLVTFLIEFPTMIKGWYVMIFSVIVSTLILILSKSKYKWIFILSFLIFGGIAWLMLGNNGYLAVSDQDVINYNKIIQDATNKFLTDGVANIQDASGLNYVDKNGVSIKGALTSAETGFKILWYGILIPAYFIISLWLIWKSFKKR